MNVRDKSFVEILEAELGELAFESFQSTDKTVRAYVKESCYDDQAARQIADSYKDQIIDFSTRIIPLTNWNAVWESNYEPVRIDDELFIGAPFHEIPIDVKYSMVIDPNMSFGTGHHPTTEMVLREMIALALDGKEFLDFGCGSAVLSIYASYRGAKGVGVEIDPHAANAATHNLKLNQITNFEIRTGGAESIGKEKFDFIAANINRNVIQETVKLFYNSMNQGGTILCSGFIREDAIAVANSLSNASFLVKSTNFLGDWTLITATK